MYKNFLNTLFFNKPDNEYTYTFTIPGMTAKYDQNLSSDIHIPKDKNVYFGIGTVKKPLATGRPGIKDITGIPGFWLDIDIKTVHKKQHVPETFTEAKVWVNHCQFPPSAIVNSGNGLHVYWILKEWFEINDKYDINKISSIAKRFQDYFRTLKPYHLDATADISRIMRLPGSYNVKDLSRPLPCFVEQLTPSAQYLLEDIVDMIDSIDIDDKKIYKKGKESHLILDKSANPPNKFMSLLAVDTSFKATWGHRRSSDEIQDQSISGYDMAISVALAKLGWSDQDICDTLIYHRKIYNTDLKIDRSDNYYSRTIAKARIFVAENLKQDESIAILEAAREDLDIARQKIQASLGIDIEYILRYGNSENPLFVICLASGQKIEIGSIENLLSQSKFGQKIFQATNKFPADVKRKEWNSDLMLMAMLYKDYFDIDTIDRNIILNYIQVYTDNQYMHQKNSGTLRSKQPFSEDGRYYFNFERFKGWLDLREKYTNPRLAMLLTQLGCEKIKISYEYTDDKEKKTRLQVRYWSIDSSKFLMDENNEK